MSLEERNNDLVTKLYLATMNLHTANRKIKELEEQIVAYEKINKMYCQLRGEHFESLKRLSHQDKFIDHIRQIVNSDHFTRTDINSSVKAVRSEVPTSAPSSINDSNHLRPPPREDPPVTRETTQPAAVNIIYKPAEEKPIKVPTIAEKLKLTLSQPSAEPTQPIPQEKKVEKPVTPRLVVKAVPPVKPPSPTQTNSIMVTKLWQGLKRNDLVDYFSRRGNIVSIQMTSSGNSMTDGSQYCFIKFADVKTVDKLLTNNGVHIIKNVTIVVKRGTHTV